jgi:hypothetical protein
LSRNNDKGSAEGTVSNSSRPNNTRSHTEEKEVNGSGGSVNTEQKKELIDSKGIPVHVEREQSSPPVKNPDAFEDTDPAYEGNGQQAPEEKDIVQRINRLRAMADTLPPPDGIGEVVDTPAPQGKQRTKTAAFGSPTDGVVQRTEENTPATGNIVVKGGRRVTPSDIFETLDVKGKRPETEDLEVRMVNACIESEDFYSPRGLETLQNVNNFLIPALQKLDSALHNGGDVFYNFKTVRLDEPKYGFIKGKQCDPVQGQQNAIQDFGPLILVQVVDTERYEHGERKGDMKLVNIDNWSGMIRANYGARGDSRFTLALVYPEDGQGFTHLPPSGFELEVGRLAGQYPATSGGLKMLLYEMEIIAKRYVKEKKK